MGALKQGGQAQGSVAQAGAKTRRGSKIAAAVSIAAIAALALSACGASGSGGASDSGAGADATASADGSATATSAAPVVDLIDVGDVPTDVKKDATKPGAELKFDETAWIESKGSSHDIIGATVRAVVELDSSAIEGFGDNPEFDIYTPYGVVIQYDWSSSTAPEAVAKPPVLEPIDAVGASTQVLASGIGNTAFDSADACGLTLPASGPTTSIECIVGLGTSSGVVGAQYSGATSVSGVVVGPYAKKPITWTK